MKQLAIIMGILGVVFGILVGNYIASIWALAYVFSLLN